MTERPRQYLWFIAVWTFASATLVAQQSPRYVRLHLHDKGTPARALSPSDSLYAAATAHLTRRAIDRRRRVLADDRVVTTDDLPVYPPYLHAIQTTGATVVQTSRWLNTVMVLADSVVMEGLRKLDFLDSTVVVRQRRRGPDPVPRRDSEPEDQSDDSLAPVGLCIAERYGAAMTQNSLIGLDYAHRLGFSGENMLIGILDAGFDWRNHDALRHCDVVAERDFVFDDGNTADEGGESGAESHGTQVMSVIGGGADGLMVGGAPHASFLLAKTEDIRSEHHVEEDHLVAGVEWFEALGADVANASLSYTRFDAPEEEHEYPSLTGHTAFASRGLNKAVELGMVCIMAAGNDGAKDYRYVGVPAEADSAIAVAAVDSMGLIARFSSRGFAGRARMKPDVAAMGVANLAADHASPRGIVSGQGTSYAAPLASSAVAVLLSARPELTPFEVRTLLYRTSDHAHAPDTAYGYGVVSVERALKDLSTADPLVGTPRVVHRGSHMEVLAYSAYEGTIPDTMLSGSNALLLRLTLLTSHGDSIVVANWQPRNGVVRWALRLDQFTTEPVVGDSVVVLVASRITGKTLRRSTVRVEQVAASSSHPAWNAAYSTLCYMADTAPVSLLGASPNPVVGTTTIRFQLDVERHVKLFLYNMVGQEVARLVDGVDMHAGYHSVSVQAAGLAPGAYTYALMAGNQIATGKVVVLESY